MKCRHSPLVRVFVFCCVFLNSVVALGLEGQEQKQDVIRAYWNPELTEIYEYTTDVADTVTVYVVIENPSYTGPLSLVKFDLRFPGSTLIAKETSIGSVSVSGTNFYRVHPSASFVLSGKVELCKLSFSVSSDLLREVEIKSGAYYTSSSEITELNKPFSIDECAWLNPGTANGIFRDLVLDMGQRGYGSTTAQRAFLNNYGDAPLFLEPMFELGCEHFAFENLNNPDTIAPRSGSLLTFSFSPDVVGEYSCEFFAAPGVELALQGVGEEPRFSLAGPDVVNNESTAVGGVRRFGVAVVNDGNVPVTLAPTFLDLCQNITTAADYEFTVLSPGDEKYVLFDLWPTTLGSYECWVAFGSGLLTTQLVGSTHEGTIEVSVTPSEVRFGEVGEDTETVIVVDYTNDGDVALYPNYQLSDPNLHFSITTEPPELLYPGGRGSVRVLYTPTIVGFYNTELSLGPDMPTLPVSATVIDDAFQLLVTPEIVQFAPTNPGETDTQLIEITNTGIYTQIIQPTTVSPLVVALTGGGFVPPGATVTVSVTYRPLNYGQFYFRIILNSERSIYVDCIGPPVLGFEPNQNRVGFFFDTNHSVSTNTIEAEPQSVTAYLAMSQPSDLSSIGGWECNIKASAGAALVNYSLNGNAINASAGYEFTVGLGLEPLPYSSDVLLGTFEFVVFDMDLDEFRLELTPTDTPSIPGMMSWVAWDDLEKIIPLIPSSGDSISARIQTTEYVATETTTPLVALRDGAIELSWPNLSEAYHVYRRIGTGELTRLTSEPLVSGGSTIFFRDESLDFATGETLHYSYRIVIGGVEVGESPEAEFTYGDQLPQSLGWDFLRRLLQWGQCHLCRRCHSIPLLNLDKIQDDCL